MKTDLDLALKYGGFTSLDLVYLENVLSDMTPPQRRLWLTPPPSVINAYFAELYQKQSPQAATDYYLSISQAFDLFTSEPSFAGEKQPFVRLNLSGKAYGFVYENNQEVAQVFGQGDYPVTPKTMIELAQIFPHYQVFHENGRIKMMPFQTEELDWEDKTNPDFPLTSIETAGDMVRITSYNMDEALVVAKAYQGQVFFHFQQRQVIITIKP